MRKSTINVIKVVLCHYLIKNAVYTTAVITEVLDWGIRVCVTKYGFRATIKFSKIPSIKITPVDSDFSSRKFVKIDFKSLQTDI
jgi:exoribonuclease R